MALSDDLKALKDTIKLLLERVEGLEAQALQEEQARGTRIGAPARMTRRV